MSVLRLLRRRRPKAVRYPARPCQAYRPITHSYRGWPNVQCNLAYGHDCAHAHCTENGITFTWPRGLDRGEVMS